MSVQRTYNHKALVEEMELFFENSPFQEIWEYTKRMVEAHHENCGEAWLQFDNTLTGEEISIPLQGIVLNLIEQLDEHHSIRLHRAITIGRARARGLSRNDAIQAHLQALEEVSPPNLRLLDGGKK